LTAKTHGETGDAKGKVVESVDVLEAGFDVVASTAKKLGDRMTNGIGLVVAGRRFEPGGDIKVAHTDRVVGREESFGMRRRRMRREKPEARR
jgi:hypothetical protein